MIQHTEMISPRSVNDPAFTESLVLGGKGQRSIITNQSGTSFMTPLTYVANADIVQGMLTVHMLVLL